MERKRETDRKKERERERDTHTQDAIDAEHKLQAILLATIEPASRYSHLFLAIIAISQAGFLL